MDDSGILDFDDYRSVGETMNGKDRIEKQKEEAENLNELVDHLIKLIDSDNKRFSFEGAAGDTMEIYDKQKDIDYVIRIELIAEIFDVE